MWIMQVSSAILNFLAEAALGALQRRAQTADETGRSALMGKADTR